MRLWLYANADWNNQMSANEQARYGCYDSGQGCGSGTHELSISGSMVQSTESSGPGTFSWISKWFKDLEAFSYAFDIELS